MHPRSPPPGRNRPHHAQIVQNLSRCVYVPFAHPALLGQALLGELVNHAGRVRLHVERQGHVMYGLRRDPTTTRRKDIRLRQRRVDQHPPQRPLGRPAREAVDDREESELELIGLACTVRLDRYRSFRHRQRVPVRQRRRGGAWPLDGCSCIGSGCSGRLVHALGASTARVPADLRHPVLVAPGVRLYGRVFCPHRIARRCSPLPRALTLGRQTRSAALRCDFLDLPARTARFSRSAHRARSSPRSRSMWRSWQWCRDTRL